MALSGIKTRSILRGNLLTLGPWASLFARASYRIYPFQLGAMVRTTSTGTSVDTHGLGQFEVNNYVLPCTPTAYGDSTLFIPQLSKVTRITAISSTDDNVTISPARSLTAGDFLLNLGNDSGGTTPVYDGSNVQLYTDPVGNTANAADYLQAGNNGHFFGWVAQIVSSVIQDNFEACDLLITNSSGTPEVVLPLFAVGPVIV